MSWTASVSLLRRAAPLGLALMLAVVPGALPAAVARAPMLVRGQSDQNEPLMLRVDRRLRLARVELAYVTHCRRTDSTLGGRIFGRDDVDLARPARSARAFRIGRRGGLAVAFRLRRHLHPRQPEGYGLFDLRSTTSVQLRGHLRGGRGGGRLRIRTVTRELIDDSESGRYQRVSRCSTGSRRWAAPRFRFSAAWRPTGRLAAPAPAFGLTLVPLGDDTLAVGGVPSDLSATASSSTQLYEAGDNRWVRPGDITPGRHGAAGVRLHDGRVLLTGGTTSAGASSSDRGSLSDASLYDPTRRSWSPAAPMHHARQSHTATVLPDGRVLVAGGFRAGPADEFSRLLSAELYDPKRGTWSQAAPMPAPATQSYGSGAGERAFHSERLPSGRVLVVGDWGSEDGIVTSTTYDPSTNAWSPRERVPVGDTVYGQSGLAMLPDGRVLLVANCNGPGATPRAAIYGPAGWSPVAAPARCVAQVDSALAPLPSGRVLLADSRRALIYDPVSDGWSQAPRYHFPHFGPQVTPAPRGALIVDRGLDRYSSAERFYER